MTVTQIGNNATEGTQAHGLLAESDSGDVTVNQIGDNSTRGDGLDGIFATSGGGNVNVAVQGDSAVFGENASAIRIFAGPRMTSTVTIHGGKHHGGTGDGAAVSFDGAAGSANQLNNAGGILQALSGVAVRGKDGDHIINNQANIVGDIEFGGGANTFNNQMGGRV